MKTPYGIIIAEPANKTQIKTLKIRPQKNLRFWSKIYKIPPHHRFVNYDFLRGNPLGRKRIP